MERSVQTRFECNMYSLHTLVRNEWYEAISFNKLCYGLFPDSCTIWSCKYVGSKISM